VECVSVAAMTDGDSGGVLSRQSSAAVAMDRPLSSETSRVMSPTAMVVITSAAGFTPPPHVSPAASVLSSADNNDRAAEGAWDRVEATDLMQAHGYRRPDILVKRLHRFFTATAAPVAFVLGVFFMLLLLKAHIEAHIVGRIIAGCCVLLSCCMTLILVVLHLSAFTDPVQQRRIVRILFMVPIYALESFAALWNHEVAATIGLARDCYESYVIYTFYNLLMGYLGGEEHALQLKRGSEVTCLFPLCWFGSFPLNRSTLRTWKALLVQYMVLKPILSVTAMYLLVHDLYDEASWSFNNAHVYFVIVQNVSVTLAFSSLVYFFVEFKDALQPHKPIGKFAAVKAVLFLTFWQSVALGLLVHFGFVKGSKEGLWKPTEVSTGIQDFVICIEMLGLCYLHRFVFSERPYVPVTGYHAIDCKSVAFLCSQSDVVLDVVEVVRPTARDTPHNKRVQ
jgi:hypothetical protein